MNFGNIFIVKNFALRNFFNFFTKILLMVKVQETIC